MTEEADGDDDVSRRWLIRLLVGLGLGVPVVVEARTLAGIVSSALFGSDGDATTTGTETTTQDTTDIGDELLPGTGPADTLEDAVVQIRDDAWQFEATVTIENTTETPYTLELGTVTTGAGTRVAATASSGRVPPGEAETVTNAWLLPSGETPVELEVAGVVHRDGDERTERTVRLGEVPVRS